VLDLVYLLLTLAFFGLMLVYVRGCERLGRDASGEERPWALWRSWPGCCRCWSLATSCTPCSDPRSS